MAIVDGWIDWAIQAPGIPDKVYTEPNKGLGLIGHSIVGSYAGAISRFMSTARDAAGNYTPNAAASVMFILCKDGVLIQCYPVTASTWTSGGRQANTSYWAIEAEGGPPGNVSEPLTDAQVKTLMRLVAEYEAHAGRKVVRGTTFREHGEIAASLGYAATSCPSNRYAKFYTALEARGEVAPVATKTDEERFLELMGKHFPSYIEAYFDGGFTTRNGWVSDGEVTDNGPIKPWDKDLTAVGNASAAMALRAVAAALTDAAKSLGSA